MELGTWLHISRLLVGECGIRVSEIRSITGKALGGCASRETDGYD